MPGTIPKETRFIAVEDGTVLDKTPPRKRARVEDVPDEGDTPSTSASTSTSTSGLHTWRQQTGSTQVKKEAKAEGVRVKTEIRREETVEMKSATELDVEVKEEVKLVVDEVYYVEDGDCFVRVQDVLFRVHSERLCMSSTIAEKLASDKTWVRKETPFRLHGADSDEFRALMWARYASHDDVKDQPRTPTDLLRLLHLALITRRHTFPELHAWTIKAIYTSLTSDPPKLPSLSSPLFTKLVEVAKECKAGDLLDAVVGKWIESVRKGEVSPLPAIKAADTWGLRGLRGIGHYTYLQERLLEAKEAHNESFAKTPTSPFLLELNPEKLNQTQQVALLQGYISLSKYTNKRLRSPLAPPRSSSCSPSTHDNCIDTWLSRWRILSTSDRIQDLEPSDPSKVLGILAGMMEEDREVCKGVGEECRGEAVGRVREEMCELRVGLVEYFRV